MRKIYATAFAVLFLILFVACGEQEARNDNGDSQQSTQPENAQQEARYVQEYRWVFDTQIHVYVHYYGTEDGEDYRRHRDIAIEAADKVYLFDQLFDRFNPESDIYRINHAGGEWVEVHPHTVHILQYGLEFRELSHGRFDITIGAVMDLWDFGFYSEELLPAQADIERALETVGADILFDGNRVRLSNPDSRIDLGGIAKGYAADYVADFLMEQGVAGVVNFQGDIRLAGEHPRDGAWGLGIADPFGGPLADPILLVQVPGEYAFVTSGTMARGFIQEGRRFHHIMDVSTGWPVITPFISITVIAESALLGEFLTSAIYTTAIGELDEFMHELDIFVEAIFIDEAGDFMSTSGLGNPEDPNVRFPVWLIPQD